MALRDELYALAGVTIDSLCATRRNLTALAAAAQESCECIEERAAILEYDAGFPKLRAEQIAIAQRTRLRRK